VPGAPVKPPEIKNIEVGGLHYQTIVDQQTGRETAYLIPGQPPPVQKPNTFQGPDNTTYLPVPDPTAPGGFRAVKMAGVDAPLPPATAVDPSKPLMTRDAAGLHPVAGMPAAPAPSASIYDQGLTPVAADNKFVGEVAMKVYAGQPVNRDQALQYAQSWNNLYAAKYQIEIINGARSLIPVEPEKPSPYPKPEIVLSKAGVDQTIIDAATKPVVVPPVGGTAPVQTGGGNAPVQTAGGPAPAPAAAPPGPKITPLETPKQPAITTEQEKSRTYAVLGDEASKYLDKLNKNNMPWGTSISGARYAATPGLVGSLVGSVTPDDAKEYMGNAKAFIEAYARPATGAQISATDYENFFASMIPLPTDPPSEFKRKSRLRAALVNVWKSGSGFQSDAERDAWFARNAGPMSRGAGPSNATAPRPANAPAEWDSLSDRGKELWRKKHGG
jgi:hypothetical protein